ncbi:hypothetical protein [Chroococcidiopsis cubana]|uniref:hypothetical protein n=1 Tax=Chroococcidiopsis cubana TaxID=171392 RepID=UPI0018F675FD|nr:hypothetical protein [Chroococcidiopsis cubana]
MKDVTKSGKLWKKNEFYYHDALQETWKYCCQNIEKYDPNRGSVINWINYYLKRRLQDFRIKEDSLNARTEPHFTSKETGEIIDPVDTLKASPDIPPMLEETRDWVQTDSDGVLRNTIFRKRPEINAQVLILLRIIPIAEWENFAWENVTPQFQPWALTGGKPQGFAEAKEWDNIWAQFELNKAEKLDLPKFYSRRCFPLLQNFAKEQGY